MNNNQKKDLLIKNLVKKNAVPDQKGIPCVTLCLSVCISCISLCFSS